MQQLVTAGRVAELALPPNRRLLIHAERVAELEERILSALRPRKEVTPRTAVLAEEKTS